MNNAARAAGEAADQLHKELYGGEGEPPVAPPVPAAVENADPATPIPPAPSAPVQPGAVDWEHKYKTLQGMFNKDIPRLNAAVTEWKTKYENQVRITRDLEQQLAARAVAPVTEKLLKDSEIEEYGEEMVDMIRRAARESVSGEINELKRANEDLRAQNLHLRQSLGTVTATTEKTARELVFDSLSSAVPDWVAINSDQGFIDWLAQEDAFSRRTLQEMLNEAFEANDAPRVVAFFQRYATESAITRRTIDPTGAAAPAPAAPTVRMDTLVAPGKPQRSQSAQPVSEFEGEIWTQEQINAFYTACSRGKYKHSPDVKASIERRIHRAVNEGRVK